MYYRKLQKRIVLIIIGLAFFHTSYCQKNYLAGYIIKTNGDTLHGFIDYRNWNENPNKIIFKKTLTDNLIKYTPIDIKEFRVHNETYESAIIKVEVSPDKISELQTTDELVFKTDTTFLQALIKGPKCLYYSLNPQEKKNRQKSMLSMREFEISFQIYRLFSL
jgi:hypothetical protein